MLPPDATLEFTVRKRVDGWYLKARDALRKSREERREEERSVVSFSTFMLHYPTHRVRVLPEYILIFFASNLCGRCTVWVLTRFLSDQAVPATLSVEIITLVQH